MKLMVGAAVLDAVDRGDLHLSDKILVRPDDTSPGPREFADLVKRSGVYEATVEELLRRSIVDSDSTSVDLLIAQLNGISAVQDFLRRKQISGIRVDRTERQLQAESLGLSWNPRFVDADAFEAAARALPVKKRDSAWEAHLKDPRDKATPIGMVAFLQAFISGRLLSKSSTEKLLEIMGQTATGQDRLRAGAASGWRVAHKTGTGRSWKGVTETTNDVGILTAPDGTRIAVAVFLAGANAPAERQVSVIAKVGQIATMSYK